MSLPSRDRQHLLPGDHDSDLDDGEPRPPPRSSRVGNLDRNALAVVFGTLIACGSLAVWWSSRSSADSPLSVDNTVSGIASQIKNSMNLSSDPCDNFYEYACGGWMRTTSLPADKDTYARSFTTIQDRNVEVLHEIVQGAGADSDDRIGILWQSCMNEAEIESQGMDPFLAQIREIRSIASLPDLLAHLGAMERMHGGFFFNVAVEVDSKDTSKYVATVHQAGLTMGDRFRYVAPETNRTADLHHHFRQLQALTGLELSQSGVDLDAAIGNVVQFEVRIAEFTKPYEELRQPLATYNLRSVRRCSDDSGLDFNTYLRNMGFSSLTDSSMVNVDNPDFLTRMGQLLQATPLQVVKDAVLLRTAVSVSDLLPGRVRDEHFAFFSTTLRGIQQQPPRYKQCIEVIDRMLGDELGQRFLKQVHFSDDQKALAASIVDTIIKEFQTSLHSVSWMDEATQNAAISKLHKVKVLVGYPKTWTNYDALQLTAGKFADNVLAACEFSMNEMIARLGRPVDPYRFSMTVPTVNAYYEPTLNSINFPAGILQLPFFSSDESVPVALNYGGIGSVIGHELVHAFDDEGRQYDGDGVLNPWWPDEVAKRFKRRSKCLGKQYASIDFNDGFHIKPELTMGENIADNGGVSAAFKAFLKTEGANPDKEFLPGINNKQLFYIAMAQNWCQVQTKEKLINQLTTDPHSPSLARVHVPLMNSPEFAEEFRCAPNSKLNPVEKCIIW